MCLIITRSKKAAIPMTDIETSYTHNSDGWGLMFAKNNRLQIHRGMGGLAEIRAALAAAGDRQLALHMRFATHGTKTLDNAHPFEILNHADHGIDLALMHNGVLGSIPIPDPARSDTWALAMMLRPVLAANPDLITNKHWLAHMGGEIGSGNKLTLMDGLGRLAHVNKHQGTTEGALWFSNDYSRRRWTSFAADFADDYGTTFTARAPARPRAPETGRFIAQKRTYDLTARDWIDADWINLLSHSDLLALDDLLEKRTINYLAEEIAQRWADLDAAEMADFADDDEQDELTERWRTMLAGQ